jgi:hypothetical protein
MSTLELREGVNRLKAPISHGIKRLLGVPGETASLAGGERVVFRAVLGA